VKLHGPGKRTRSPLYSFSGTVDAMGFPSAAAAAAAAIRATQAIKPKELMLRAPKFMIIS
jgi:hypothetical protein